MATPGRGRLLVVGTPLGNLGDLSPRAAEALRAADAVVAEDTRVAARLLAHLGIKRPTISFFEANAATRIPELLARLTAGETLALTTDAGMPGVSDPGAILVRAAREAGHGVEVVPGPSAVTAAMALSGVEAAGFVFGGFLPARPRSDRREALDRLLAAASALGLPLLLYEAPHRVRALLAELVERVPASQLVLARELTKLHEEVLVGSAAEVAERLVETRGEFVVLVHQIPPAASGQSAVDLPALAAAAAGLGLPQRSIAELLRAAGLPHRRAYALATQAVRPAPPDKPAPTVR